MRIRPLLGSAVGPVSPTRWGQVLVTPTAYAVVEVGSSEPDGAMQRGVAILSKLSEALREDLVSLRQVREVVRSLGSPETHTALVIVPVGSVLYIALEGNGAAYLKRGPVFSLLLDGSGALSGSVQEGDLVLLVSRRFAELFAKEELIAIFDHLDAQQAAEKLTLALHQKTGGEGSAALVFQVTGLIAEEAAEPSISIAQPEPRERIMVRQGVGRALRHRLKRIGPRTWLPNLRASRKTQAIVTLLLLVLFGASVAVGILRQRLAQSSQVVAAALADAQFAYDEGIALLPLNAVKGRERLVRAKELVDPLTRSVSPRSKEGRDVARLWEQITQNLELSMAVVREEPQLFYDVSLLKAGAKAHRIAVSGDTLGVLDAESSTIFAVTVSSKKGQIVGGGGGLTGAIDIAVHGTTVYAVSRTGIQKIDIGDKKAGSAVPADDSWGRIGALWSFGGSLYLLDTDKSRIWKYIATDKGFSEQKEYLNPDTLPDLRQATGMAIDGSVWVGTKEGNILKFTQGMQDSFTARGVDPAFDSAVVVYTSDELKALYILDTAHRRVVVLDKDGLYLSQYVWKGELNPTQFVVSEAQRKLLLLVDDKLYFLELKL